MDFKLTYDTPFRVRFSFEPLFQQMKDRANDNAVCAAQYQLLLEEVNKHPKLLGELNSKDLEKYKDVLERILTVVFPPFLQENEIKAISIPFSNILFNPTKRLQNIIDGAGKAFSLQLRDFTEEQFYVMSCCVILASHYHAPVKTDFPLIFDIPNKEGFINHFRVLSNADFLQFIPTQKAPKLSESEIQELVDNFENYELWKEKFPPNSWELHGFGIVNIFDATTEIAISNLKGILIQKRENFGSVKDDLNQTFRSIFRIANLNIGYTGINFAEKKLEKNQINQFIKSSILPNSAEKLIYVQDDEDTFIEAIGKYKFLAYSTIEAFNKANPKSYIGEHLKNSGIKSVIFTPFYRDGKLLGVLEITSTEKLLNSINAEKMNSVLPYLEESLNQLYTNMENHVAALIQQEYTSIHPSVYWKFREEATKHMNYEFQQISDDPLPFKSIAFSNLHPLYGQSDIKSSSAERNFAIVEDLKNQIDMLQNLFESLNTKTDLSALSGKLTLKKEALESGLKANTESDFLSFIQKEINPVLNKLKFEDLKNNEKITNYYYWLDPTAQVISVNRKRYDDSISYINKELSSLLDKRQEEQQGKFPFYYERFKTDGVEHNIYVGSSIAPWLSYDSIYLKNLRLWQLRVIVESEVHFKNIKNNLPQKLDITSLILAYSTPINIRFRMDEKRFDVDGSYNARYEIIKKRIDKAHLKNTTERLVQVEKISVVFAQNKERDEYLNYIKILQNEGSLQDDLEIVDLEDLQGIIGLQAIRVSINGDYKESKFEYPFFAEL